MYYFGCPNISSFSILIKFNPWCKNTKKNTKFEDFLTLLKLPSRYYPAHIRLSHQRVSTKTKFTSIFVVKVIPVLAVKYNFLRCDCFSLKWVSFCLRFQQFNSYQITMIPIYPLKICGTWFNLFLYTNGKIKWPLFKKNENDRSQGLSLRFSKIKRKLLLEAGWMVWRKFLQILNLCNFSWYYYLLGYILQGY